MQTPSSLRDTDKDLTNILKLFLQEADPHWMKTTDNKHSDSKLVENRKCDAHNLTLMITCLKIVHELLMHPTALYLSQPFKNLCLLTSNLER